jgi:putative ABC transport system substrate-binding protein
VVGVLGAGSGAVAPTDVRRGLSETGFIDGQNVAIEYRSAENHPERFAVLANDLVRRQIAVIIALSTPAALAAKAATSSIPISFSIGADPVAAGLVASLSRPGSNLTGVTNFGFELSAKRLELLRQLVPSANSIGVLQNPDNAVDTEAQMKALRAAAGTLAVRLLFLNATEPGDFEGAFARLVQGRVGGLVINDDVLFLSHIDELVSLTKRYAVPTMFMWRAFTSAGGLMSYGIDRNFPVAQAAVYAGRILKGEKPANLPVLQPTKFELVINLKTASALGVAVPATLLVAANEVIE